MDKPFKAFDHGTNRIDLRHHPSIELMRPIEIHHKADGSVKDEPSFAIVMKNPWITVSGEVSLEMLNAALNDIGYAVVRK